ncbi:hypothetical protein RAH32_06195 [Paracoccus sp. WLY502]|uniref:hypothetical protein n=1 Tax=Paracoccus yibinensis TaxID=3068891 RepID=UPI00279666B2|nr:hypothetical protein [Paracoccus sp. WLY502]MDQ1900031.1 hypothetical protein [Paracoccus sp. WLY502]
MQTSIPVIHVSQVTPTSPAPVAPIPEAAPVSLFKDVIEKITPPMEFRDWMEKLKTYAEAARGTEPAEQQQASVAEAERATPALPAARAVPEAVPAEIGKPADDATADPRQAEIG